jgi:prophage tail gpP-like protein
MQQRVPNPDEIAKLSVGGSDFQYFESVMVQLHFSESANYFRFTAVEMPGVEGIKIQSDCTVTLGGEQAVKGLITVRQVAYDANTHAIELRGKSNSWLAARASVLNSQTGSYDNRTFQDIATEVLKPFNMPPPTFNGVDNSPYQTNMHINPGETVWNFLERIARQKRIICGVDQKGNFQFTGKLPSNKLGTLEEGKNILKMKYVNSCEGTYSEYVFQVQSVGNDKQFMKKAAAPRTDPLKGSLKQYSPIMFPHENASYPFPELDKRNQNEHDSAEGRVALEIITVKRRKEKGGGL